MPVADPVQLVAKPAAGFTFMAIREDCCLVHVARYPKFGPAGQAIGQTIGSRVQFRHNRFDVPAEGTVRLDGGGEMEAADLKQWLDQHPLNGDKWDGFFAVEQSAPQIGVDEQQTMMRAAMRLDIETLQEMLRQEQAGWNREEMTRLLTESITEIEQAVAKKA